MKKTLIVSCIITLLVLSGCAQKEKEIVKADVPLNTGITAVSEKTAINVHWEINSGISIPGKNISISGQTLNYNNLFSITISKKWLSKRDFYNTYWDTLNITDGDLNSVQINTYTLSQNSKCDYNFEEWVLSLSKSSKVSNEKKLNLANVLFEISWPGIDKPIKSWQSFICFTEWESIYKITVSDDESFKTDIINSFKFLK